MNIEDAKHLAISTRAVHAGQEPDPSTGAIMTPVYQTSTYVQEEPCVHKGYEYSRSSNPTRTALEANLAALENGAWGLAFASGMAAIDALARALLKPGDHVVASNDLYGGTYRLFTNLFAPIGITFDFVDAGEVSAMEGAMRDETRMLFVESPTNPLLKLCDLEAASAMAHDHGALAVCDNTFATPVIQRPLERGFDLVVHSTTKYLAGHSDVVGGAVVGSDADLREQIAYVQNAAGAVPGPQDCFLTLRGTKTLFIRMLRHSENALAVAEWLEAQDIVTSVTYPGIESHPQHELACRQMDDSGGMISFILDGGEAAGRRLAASTVLFACAESLGGVESLIEHPTSMTHASVPPEERAKAGLDDGLIRLSVGIEDPGDLIRDLETALKAL